MSPAEMSDLPKKTQETDPEGLLAYVIYTSSSTGRPKGALVTHRGLEAQL